MKTYISDSLISEGLIMMQAMKQNNCYDVKEIYNIRPLYGINVKATLDLATSCNWLTITNNTYEITSMGEKLLNSFNGFQLSPSLYQDILRNYILTCKPIWARRIPYGRNEAYLFMSEEEQVCFKKAGLMETPVSRKTVDWWDALAKIQQREAESIKNEVGRQGEELTITYEENRTKVMPTWESIDSNFAGFDVLSQVSIEDRSQILIEVKASKRDFHSATFYISHDEWSFASYSCNRNRYYFYLWLVGDCPQLAVVPYSSMIDHIPTDKGLGEWSEVEIPFSAFESLFCFV